MRWSTLVIIGFWLASTGWLVWEKVLPPLLGGEAPEYVAAPREPAPVVWRILWNDRQIGASASKAVPRERGGLEMRSVVSFEQLPLGEMAGKLFGPVGVALGPLLSDDVFGERMTFATRIDLAEDRLERFHTAVRLGDNPPAMHVRGRSRPGGKLLITMGNGAAAPGGELFRQEVALPNDAIVADAFSPHPEMKDLRIGQKWTIPVYRPFPPGAPMRILAAEAERHEILVLGREPVETIVVVYRDEAGSGIRASREPVGRAWVRGDGVVLRQELNLSGLTIVMERMPDEAASPTAELLDDSAFAELQGAAPK